MTEATETAGARLAADLAHFTGTERWYSHWTRSCVYTDGVKYFAEKAGAYWFLDILATEFTFVCKRHEFLGVTLAVKDGTASIIVDDGDGKVLRRRKIDFTDCPEGDWKFYFIDGARPTILLPSEY